MPSNKFKNILYVDDDEDMLTLIKAVLELDSNLNIQTFTSPILALTEIKNNPPDLIILDYQIPEMNGTQVMEQIHEMKIESPIVFFTAQSAPEEKNKLKQLGAKKVITKPVDIDDLHNQLTSI